MVDVFLQGTRILHRINKDEGNESLTFLVFWRHIVNVTFLKYSKEGRLFSSHVGNQNIPSDTYVPKHYQVQFEHRRTQKPLKHLRWRVFVQPVNTLKSLTGHAKKLHLRCWNGFWKQGNALQQIPLLQSKARVRCTERTFDVTMWNINLRDVYFETFQWY